MFAIVNQIKRLLYFKQLRIEKHASLFFFFPFCATSFIIFSHSENFSRKVGFDAESIVFFTFFIQ